MDTSGHSLFQVTRSSRYPLLIDPQGQALNWIRRHEKDRLPASGVTSFSSDKLRDTLEYCMMEGKALIIAGVEEDIDPMLTPVLEKQVYLERVRWGRRQSLFGKAQRDFESEVVLKAPAFAGVEEVVAQSDTFPGSGDHELRFAVDVSWNVVGSSLYLRAGGMYVQCSTQYARQPGAGGTVTVQVSRNRLIRARLPFVFNIFFPSVPQ